MSNYLVFAYDTEHDGLNGVSTWDIVESTPTGIDPTTIDRVAESMSRDVIEDFMDFYALEDEYYENCDSFDNEYTFEDYMDDTIYGRTDYQYWQLNAHGQQFGTGYLWSKFVEDPVEFYNEFIKGGPDDDSDDGFDSDYWSVRLP